MDGRQAFPLKRRSRNGEDEPGGEGTDEAESQHFRPSQACWKNETNKTPTVTEIICPRKMVIQRGKSVVMSLLAEIEFAVMLSPM